VKSVVLLCAALLSAAGMSNDAAARHANRSLPAAQSPKPPGSSGDNNSVAKSRAFVAVRSGLVELDGNSFANGRSFNGRLVALSGPVARAGTAAVGGSADRRKH
jgi:hypothetical protein